MSKQRVLCWQLHARALPAISHKLLVPPSVRVCKYLQAALYSNLRQRSGMSSSRYLRSRIPMISTLSLRKERSKTWHVNCSSVHSFHTFTMCPLLGCQRIVSSIRDLFLYQVQDDVKEVFEGLAARKMRPSSKVMTFTQLPRTLPEKMHSIDKDIYLTSSSPLSVMVLKNDIEIIEGHDLFIKPVLALVQTPFSQTSIHHLQHSIRNTTTTNK